MRWRWVLVALALVSAGTCAVVQAATPQKIALQAQRSTAQDLEISGDVPGLPVGASGFVRYVDLAALPQVSFTVTDPSNFNGPVQVSGVPLETLVQELGFSGGKQLIAAASADGYEGHYTAEYRTAHHPVLVLKMSGKEPVAWARGPDGEVYAPYFVENPAFRPSFKVLSHVDEPQVPIGVVKLRFYAEDTTLAALRPAASAGPAAMQGIGSCCRTASDAIGLVTLGERSLRLGGHNLR